MDSTTYDIFHPPRVGERVGTVRVVKTAGGCSIKATVADRETSRFISDRLPFFNLRANRATRTMISRAEFQASLVYDQPDAIDNTL